VVDKKQYMSEANPHKVLDSITYNIVKTLIDNPERNYTKKSLAEASDVDRSSIYHRWDTLTELDILKKASVESKRDYYIFNRDSKASKLLEEFLEDIIEVDDQ